jgi:hypothetical protein
MDEPLATKPPTDEAEGKPATAGLLDLIVGTHQQKIIELETKLAAIERRLARHGITQE